MVIVQFVSKEERERERMIKEARMIYESIFPPEIQEDSKQEKKR